MDNRVLFGVMCILFNSIGVPCFMQGNSSKGVKRIILGIQVLKMTDEEFNEKKATLSSGIPA